VNNQRNLILAMLLSGLLLFGWEAATNYFYPNAHKPKVAATASATTSPGLIGSVAPQPTSSSAAKPSRDGGLGSAADQFVEAQDLKTALNPANRIAIAAPGLSGSINLKGGVVDDLVANRHRANLDKNSPPERIFSPAGTPAQQFAQLGWKGQGVATPDANTLWTAPAGARLTPQAPVTLSWTSPSGPIFHIAYAIDQDYMLTVTQTVENKGTAPITVTPIAQLNRTDRTASVSSWNIHSGPFGSFDGSVSFSPNYKDVAAAGQVVPGGKADWIGFTDIYWMSVLIPQGTVAASNFMAPAPGIFLANVFYQPATIAPGSASMLVTRLFAGAKEGTVLDRYEASGVPHFSLAIDWGWFRWFEKPILMLLRALFHATGNFGLAIILLTVIVRGIMFPIAQRQFASMAAMRAIQPKMKALQERHKEDKAVLQRETMKLYKEEGVNPLAGCLPIFLQMPVFFALYKVLMVSIEMRHQPFILWIHDLSAPDPLHILNLFGLIPWDPPSLLSIGILGLLLGCTMWGQFKLQPQQADPAQQQMMSIMPWMMMFVMAPFASGLLVYWITTNCLVILQQFYLYSRHPQLKAQASKDATDAAHAAARTRK
jgi:YidC/Oxa1 family membrane protein insertase